MRGIEFIDVKTGESRHTSATWDLIMSAKKIGLPEPRIIKVDMPDRDGEIDQSEVLRGRVSYRNRALSFSFIATSYQWLLQLKYSEIVRFVHGKRLKIIDPDTPYEYYMGRCIVSEPTFKGEALMFFDISVDADPYRLDETDTVTYALARAGGNVAIYNSGVPVVPTIAVDADITIRFGNYSATLVGGAVYRIPEITLNQGTNVIDIIAGEGRITFTYRKGSI